MNVFKCPCGQSWNKAINDFRFCPDCGRSVDNDNHLIKAVIVRPTNGDCKCCIDIAETYCAVPDCKNCHKEVHGTLLSIVARFFSSYAIVQVGSEIKEYPIHRVEVLQNDNTI